jgi:hypothetical protein
MRLILFAMAGAVLLAMGLLAGFFLPRFLLPPPGPRMANTPSLLVQIQTLSQLVSVKFVIEKVVVLEDVKWYGENRLLMVAHGNVKAGVDLGQLKPGDLKIGDHKITISLPPAIITDAYLDDQKTQVIERSTGTLRQFDKDLEQNGRRMAVDEIKRAARVNGILKEADDRARLQLENLFRQLGYAEVEFK